MECEEEELEPWQKTVPEINLIDLDDDDDDDEPIFVGEICSSKPAANTRQGVTLLGTLSRLFWSCTLDCLLIVSCDLQVLLTNRTSEMSRFKNLQRWHHHKSLRKLR